MENEFSVIVSRDQNESNKENAWIEIVFFCTFLHDGSQYVNSSK